MYDSEAPKAAQCFPSCHDSPLHCSDVAIIIGNRVVQRGVGMITRRSLGAATFGLIASQSFVSLLAPGKALSASVPLGLDRFSRTLSADRRTQTLSGLVIDLKQETVPQNLDLVVNADIVRISGNIRMPGLGLTIIARRIDVTEPATIDTSGNIGSPNHTLPAAPGADFGKDGSNGANGGDGQAGGAILLCAGSITGRLGLISNGGKGGTAQSGGDGAAGRPGRDWVHGMARGENGGSPGQGGLAGMPGKGGATGAIAIFTLDQSFDTVSATASPGPPGETGKNGMPGAPGKGGKGGRESFTTMVPCVT